MAIESEIFGNDAGVIDVSVEVENGYGLLCCGLQYLRFILEKKSGSRLAE